MLHKAFTLVELIFVIVIVSILSVMMVPRMNSSELQDATDQVIKHMRLAQSLALVQDFYLSEATQSSEYTNINQRNKASVYWFKRWWQIQFHNENAAGASYSVYSDHPSDVLNAAYSAQPEYSATATSSDLIAIDAHTGQYIVRDTAGVPASMRLEDVDIGDNYNVQFNMSQCTYVSGNANSTHILFDHMGRPHCGKANTDVSFDPYEQLVNAQIKITLTHNDTNEKSEICVEKESGFIHLCG